MRETILGDELREILNYLLNQVGDNDHTNAVYGCKCSNCEEYDRICKLLDEI